MFSQIHSLVVSILGELPMELTFVYGMCDILVFIAILWACLFPFIFLYNSALKRW